MTWTDERLDDLVDRVDAGFEQVNGDIRRLDEKFDKKLNGLDEKFDKKLNGLDEKFDELQGLIIKSLAGMIVSFILALIAAILTVLLGG